MAALDNIASELLKSANEADLIFKKTRDQAQRDKAVRLRRIVENLKAISAGGLTPTLDQVLTEGNTSTNTLNVGGITTDYVQLDTAATPTLAPGMFAWNDAYGTADLRLKGNNVTLQLGQETLARVVNKTGSDLLESEYKVVRVRVASEGGAQGQRLAVVLAQGLNDPDSATTLGIVTETIPNNQEGFITVFGNVNNINTTGSLQGETWVDGDVLYLSPTIAGGLTKVKPIAPQHMVVMGYVVYAHAINGKIFVKVDNGYELDELHNVLITSPANNDLLQYNSAQQVWKNVASSVAVPTPTLAQVTTAGNTTTNAITVGGLTSNGNVNVGSNFVGNGTTQYVHFTGGSGEFRFKNGSGGGWYYTWCQNGSTGLEERMRLSSGNNLLIGTTTDAGYKLDVNGTARINSSLYVTDPSYTGAGRLYQAANSTLVLTGGPGGGSENITFGPSNRIFINAGQTRFPGGSVQMASTLTLGNSGNATSTNMFLMQGSITAGSALGRGIGMDTILVAAANNDVLVGLDVNPTFTNGAFTGVTNWGIRSAADFTFTARNSTITVLSPAASSNGNSLTIKAGNATTSGTGGNLLLLSGSGVGGPGSGQVIIGNDTSTYNNVVLRGYTYVQSTGPNQGTAFAVLAGGQTALSIYWDNLTPFMQYGLVTSRQSRFVNSSSYTFDNNLIIGATTDAGYKLDVNGTARIQGVLTSTANINGLTVSNNNSNPVIGSDGTNVLIGSNQAYRIVFSSNRIDFKVSDGTNPVNAGSFTSSGSLYVGGNASTTAKLQVSGSVTASTALAQGVYFNNTLVAAANNDVLVGLDVTPTFTNGAFTNVVNLALRTNGNVQVRGNTTQYGLVFQVLDTAGSNNFYVRDIGDALLKGTLWLGAQNGNNWISGGNLGIYSNTGTVGQVFFNIRHNNGNAALQVQSNSNILLNPVAGNVLVGTTTDAGYKLDVNGTARVLGTHRVWKDNQIGDIDLNLYNGQTGWQGGMYYHTESGGANQRLTFYSGGIIGTADALTINASRNVGIGTTSPATKLDIAGAHVSSIGLLRLNSTAGNISAQTYYIDGAYKSAIYAGTDNNFYLWGRAGDILLTTTTSNTERMRITSGGNVLIATTTDTGESLQVNGSIKSSALTLNGPVLATGGVLSSIAGYTGLFTVPTNPPGMQTLDIQNGIIVNVL